MIAVVRRRHLDRSVPPNAAYPVLQIDTVQFVQHIVDAHLHAGLRVRSTHGQEDLVQMPLPDVPQNRCAYGNGQLIASRSIIEITRDYEILVHDVSVSDAQQATVATASIAHAFGCERDIEEVRLRPREKGNAHAATSVT